MSDGDIWTPGGDSDAQAGEVHTHTVAGGARAMNAKDQTTTIANASAVGTPFADAMRRLVHAATAKQAEIEEYRARILIRAALPRRLAWLIDHPKLLTLYFRIRPKKRPTMVVER